MDCDNCDCPWQTKALNSHTVVYSLRGNISNTYTVEFWETRLKITWKNRNDIDMVSRYGIKFSRQAKRCTTIDKNRASCQTFVVLYSCRHIDAFPLRCVNTRITRLSAFRDNQIGCFTHRVRCTCNFSGISGSCSSSTVGHYNIHDSSKMRRSCFYQSTNNLFKR